VTVISTDANGDAAKLNSDIEDLITQKVDGIIISGAWLEQLPSAMDSIAKAGIPVVLVDRQWKSGYTSYVGPNNFVIGQQDGQYIVDRLAGKGTVVMIKGGPADNSIGLNRTNGALDIFSKNPDIKVIAAPDFGSWSEDGGLKQMENLLAANAKIDAVFCENDSMCLGAQRAIADAKRSEEMFLCGVDGQKQALEQIKNKTNYACTGLNNADQIGRTGFNRLMNILAGAAAPKDTYLNSPRITIDNVIKFYDPNSLF
jgi:ribose transport system substrate-binding protein